MRPLRSVLCTTTALLALSACSGDTTQPTATTPTSGAVPPVSVPPVAAPPMGSPAAPPSGAPATPPATPPAAPPSGSAPGGAPAPVTPITPTAPPPGVAAVPPLSAASKWSDLATWGGTLPPAGAQVVIPAGRAIVLDVDTPALGGLHVQGALYFGDRDVELTARWVMVNGLLQAGSEAQPHRHRATITLTGIDETHDVFGMGTKFIGAMAGGRIELHGHRRDAISWSKLSAHAAPGDTAITLAETVDWRVGDQIAIAPSGFDAREAEKVTITAVAGNRVSFAPALRHRHWGEVQMIEGRAVDQRAAVGLLTRDIVIRGDAASDASAFGGHVMVMGGGFARVAGVEFHRMGQAGHAARYPLHWHLVDRQPANGISGQGQYAVGNSIHDSFQRAIVMHGTSNLRAERNVGYNVHNHMFVPAEDGDEENNVWRHNLGILTKPPIENAFPVVVAAGPATGMTLQQEGKSSTFWMRNTNNVFEYNVAAGSVGGNGFMFDGFVQFGEEDRADGPRAPLRVQRKARTTVFNHNVAHSNCQYEGTRPTFHGTVYEGAANFHGLLVHAAVLNTRYLPGEAGVLAFRNFTAFKNCRSGAWIEDGREQLIDTVLADNNWGVNAEDGPRLDNVLIVGASANDIGGQPQARGGVVFNDAQASTFALRNTTFVNVDGGALVWTDDFVVGGGVASKVKLVNSVRFDGSGDLRGGSTGFMLDEDGSLSGTGVPTRISFNPLGAQSVAVPIRSPGNARFYLTPN